MRLFSLALFITLWGCSVATTRPVQEMSDTAAAIHAAREVQADVLAPELFRQSSELFFKARQEYKFKYYDKAKEHALLARKFAEQAELDALVNGGSRASISESSNNSAGNAAPEEAPTKTE